MSRDKQPDPKYFLFGLWILVSAITGGILINSDFFNDYVATDITPAIVSLIGIFGAVGFFTALAFVQDHRLERWCYRIVIITSLAMLVGVTVPSVVARIHSPYHVSFVSDSMVQMESAARLLLRGQNPYTADFTDTASGSRFDPGRTGRTNPARDYYVYAPLSAVAVIPVVLVSDAIHIPPDGRWLSIAALVVVWLLLIRRTTSIRARTILTLLTIGNPLLSLTAVAGFNDLIVVVALVGAAIYGQQRRWVASALCLVAAVGLKQTSWLFAFLWLPWMWSDHLLTFDRRMKAVGAGLGLGAFIFVPFILWNAPAFFADAIWYMSVAQSVSPSVAGASLGQYIQSIPGYGPAIKVFVELILGASGLGLGTWLIRRYPSAMWWLIGGSIATLLLSVAHQFFYFNYIIGLIAVLIAAYALSTERVVANP